MFPYAEIATLAILYVVKKKYIYKFIDFQPLLTTVVWSLSDVTAPHSLSPKDIRSRGTSNM